MAGSVCARRELMRLLACCVATRGVLGAAAEPLPAWLRPQRKPPPPAVEPLQAWLRPQRKPRPPPPNRVVVIDPGHGGIDPGAIGADGVYEKNIVLPTALALARMLAATHLFRVFLTRRADAFVPLVERVAQARARHADMFLSIHADALPDAALRGLSVYTISAQASDRDAAALARSENRELVDGVNLKGQPREVGAVLLELARRETGNQSLALADDVVRALGREVALRDNPRRAAGFVVLSAPDIPSVLVELGCLSNPVEGRLLQRAAYQERLARGLAEAVEAYFAGQRPS